MSPTLLRLEFEPGFTVVPQGRSISTFGEVDTAKVPGSVSADVIGRHRGSRRFGVVAAMLLAAGFVVTQSAWSRSAGSSATNLVVNGTFSSPQLGFTSAYTETINLNNPQTFTLGLDPAKYNGNWPTIKAHADVGKMMIVNGAIVANKPVWSESLAVKPDSSYVFSLWITSLYASPPVLKLEANAAVLGTGTPYLKVGLWKKLSFTWQSGSAKTVKLSFVDTNLAFGGNDFALSEIALTGPAPS